METFFTQKVFFITLLFSLTHSEDWHFFLAAAKDWGELFTSPLRSSPTHRAFLPTLGNDKTMPLRYLAAAEDG